ncbi:MAG TPA: Abi family protein [Terracidiphilus sp.]|jgi:abortive infection bacteriophage resistance protein
METHPPSLSLETGEAQIGGFFHFGMKYAKPHLPYEDQVNLLISRGLECPDRSRALLWLKRTGYYRLSAYFLPFKNPGTDTFRPGTTLDHVLDLYEFDSGLRLLVLDALDSIEVCARAVITYHLAKDLGVFGYADSANFAASYNHAEFMKLLKREEGRSSEVFIAHYRGKYTSETELPVWMATELITFGALSKMYEHLRTGLRKRIAREFNQPQPVFVSWLHALTAVRNVCAHHSRLWNRELAVKPELPTAWKASGIGNDRFYVIALIIQTLLADISPDSQWGERLKALFNAHPAVNLRAMQFPANWKNLPPWS